ncbi:polyprenol monophosphomannose synthase [Corynebacterium imitans]|uniref:polyprenol monophosphomannose synthase n=1 Tax=Corynebacterium TaxID=1716 RepID=UPI0008A5C129|nr:MULTISPECIES: polyprenol monophosphomannose synthase [Corynebacterium]MCG7277402.1 polyprenol monophosphomannose synthase [Corynebacterium imitans]OHF39485.1 polyprenol monophosphomannose synthase [Corynebacterium sp. HMSC074A01]
MANSTLVIIPTYNELENLPLITDRVLKANPNVDLLIVDDNSPDGTGEKADELAAAHPELNVLHRTGKEGLLAAYRAGFRWGLEKDYEVLCQMDADGSHAPEELERLLGAIDDGADLVIGSRYVEGGEVKNWPQNRYLLSKLGNQYISVALGCDIADMTAGYRAFRREVLEAIDLDALSNKGYIFQVDLAHKVIDAGFDVREVPITFEDRTLGESKLDASFAGASLVEVTKWGAEKRSWQATEMAKEAGKLLQYEYNNSKLSRVGAKIDQAPEELANMIAEGFKLAKFELSNTSLPKLPAKLADAASQANEMVREGIGLARYELRRFRR